MMIAMFAKFRAAISKNTKNKGKIFIRSDNSRIKLNPSVIHTIEKYRQKKDTDKEAGGILLGRFIMDSNDIVVDFATTPMRGDIRDYAFFYRDAKRHQKKIDKYWIKSDGTCSYLGEWHTHFEFQPTPSIIDIKDWTRKLQEDQFSGKSLFFVIAGINTIKIWEGNSKTLLIEKLEQF
jgi:integrative and conjugative element protein (TIGR02256 family)